MVITCNHSIVWCSIQAVKRAGTARPSLPRDIDRQTPVPENYKSTQNVRRFMVSATPSPSAIADLIRAFCAQRCRGVLALERDGKMGVRLDVSRSIGVSRLEVIEGPSGRRRRTKAERARIAAESMMPGVTVADVARKHGTTRWQVYDWRKQIRKGNLLLPESVAALPMFAELVVADPELALSSAGGCPDIKIVVGDIVISAGAGAGAGEGQLTRAVRAARARTSFCSIMHPVGAKNIR